MGRGRILGTVVIGLLALAAAQPATAAAAVPAAEASTCATPPGNSDTLYSATDATPAAVTTSAGSTTLSITVTAETYFNYLDPVFSIDTRNGNDGIKPSYTPPSFEYSVNGGSWSPITTHFDSSGSFGGNVWAAYLPEWTGVANGAATTLRVKVGFGSSMPHGSYNDWFGINGDEVCSVENLPEPLPARLAALTYSPPAAAPTTRPAKPPTTAAAAHPTGSANGTGSASTASTSAAANASSSGSPASSASPSPSADSGTSTPSPGPSAKALTDAQNAADRNSSGSSTLPWLLVLGALVLLAGVGGASVMRRRSRD